MDTKLDAFLEKTLKKWVSQQQPPADAREQLMQRAERIRIRRLARIFLPDEMIALRPSVSPLSTQWSQRDFNWGSAFWFGNDAIDPAKFWSESLQLRAL
jgi:hypothetical protein